MPGREPGGRGEQEGRYDQTCLVLDADDKLIGYLKDGTIAALLLQDPYRMGYDGVKTALAASKGEKVPANVDTGANLVTKANMDNPKEHALLDPPVK